MVQLADQKKPEQEFNFRRVFKATFGSLQPLTMLVLFWGVVVEAMALILLGHLLQQHQKRGFSNYDGGTPSALLCTMLD